MKRYVRLNAGQRSDLLDLARRGMKYAAIAMIFNVSESAVSQTCKQAGIRRRTRKERK